MLKKLSVSLFLLSVYSAHALAAGGNADHGGGHHEKTSGLPQLDATTFPSQIFWMIVIFAIMYFFFAKKSLPEISTTIENRAERITSDLDSAERLKEEVASVQKSYEESLTGARDESSAMYTQIEHDIKAKTEKYTADFQEFSAKQVQDLEKSIGDARKKAISEMSDVAAEVAKESAKKIIGVDVDDKYARSVVDSLASKSVKKAA